MVATEHKFVIQITIGYGSGIVDECRRCRWSTGAGHLEHCLTTVSVYGQGKAMVTGFQTTLLLNVGIYS